MNGKMDVIITSSCRSTIKRTLKSFIKQVQFSGGFNYIVNIDVKDPRKLKGITDYLEELDIFDVTVNRYPGGFHYGHTKALNSLFSRVSSPYFFHLQDDWLFLHKINLDHFVDIMEQYEFVNHIRLSKEKIKDKIWLYYLSESMSDEYMIPAEDVSIGALPLVKTITWSFNPSLVRTKVIKHFLNIPIGVRAETFVCKEYITLYGEEGCYIYGQIGDSPSVKDIGRSRLPPYLKDWKNAVINFGK